MTKLLTNAEAAARMNILPQSLRLKRIRGTSPPYVRLDDAPNSRVFYPEEDLEAWLSARPRFTSTLSEKAALREQAKGRTRAERTNRKKATRATESTPGAQ